ncbi:MAG: polysaccharide biosynthesis protein [Sporocytophaga sp.]|uniref:polysaccharide biosynthesis protein n=1 Tax=Sporocytophaga sp. TaxID=2231183 RepID=UPI001B014D46|nr:polysaccharide biosynthesis protein [Sporocytophaga sp.]MBO9699695.1 polysaccharide biosynthesis protein [Sporocytophaga sp.]
MKVLFNRFSGENNLSLQKVTEWSKLLAISGSAQIIIQAIGFVSGILVIRLLSTQEYGLYTLANSMLGTMILLADGGISSGVMALGGQVWRDRGKLGAVLVTGLSLRRKFAIGSLAIAVPVLMYMFYKHDIKWQMSLLIVAALIPSFFTSLTGSLLQVTPKLRQDILPLQKNQVSVNVLRLILLSILLFFFPFAWIAVLAGGLSQIWANIGLRKISDEHADWDQKVDEGVQKEMLVIVKRILPGAVYYCLYGQITIWLISIFGSIDSVAQIGALSRLAMILSLVGTILTTLAVPRFARLEANKKLLLSRAIQLHTGLFFLLLSIIGVVWLFPEEVLWVLGREYSNLQIELFLNIIGSCLVLFAGLSFSLLTCRGWIISPFVSIPVSILSIISGLLLIDISTLQGFLTFNIFICSVQVLLNGSYCIFRILKL